MRRTLRCFPGRHVSSVPAALCVNHSVGAPVPPPSFVQCKKHNVDCSPPQTTARLLDKLVGEFIESQVGG